MIRFYFHPTPNPAKVALLLEEAQLPYQVIPVDTSKGDQHKPEFREVNPNGKGRRLSIRTGLGGTEVRVFDSTAILLYLAEKTGKFLGASTDRPELLSCDVDRHRRGAIFGAGSSFPVRGAGRARLRDQPLSPRGGEALPGAGSSPGRTRVFHRRRIYDRGHVGLGLARPLRASPQGRGRSASGFPNLKSWFERIDARPAVVRARAGQDHAFKRVNDEETKRALFPSNYPDVVL